MNESRTISAGLVDGFQGENRTLAEHRLAAGVSPDATNCFYQDGKLRKRLGPRRLLSEPRLTGGLRVSSEKDYGPGASYVTIADNASYHFSGDFTYRIFVSPYFAAVTDNYKFVLRHSDGNYSSLPTTGVSLCLYKSGGAYYWRAYVATAAGLKTVTGAAAVVSGDMYWIEILFNTTTGILYLFVNGVSVSTSIAGTTFVPETSVFRLGDTAGSDPAIHFVVDDLQVWNKTWTGHVAVTFYNRRELDADEDTTYLMGYWKFNKGTGTAGSGYSDYPDSSIVNNSARAYSGCVECRGLVLGPSGFDRVTGLAPVEAVDPVSEMLVCTEQDVYRHTFSTGVMDHLYPADATSARRWRWATWLGWTVLMNGAGKNLRYHPTYGMRLLSIEPPTLSALTLTEGSGGSLTTTSAYSYLVSFYESDTGVESAVATYIASKTLTGGNNKITLGGTDDLPDTNQLGVDKLRIYRTKGNGTVFYWLADVAIHTETYEDTAADSTLTVLRNEYVGYCAPSRDAVVYQGRLWCANQSVHENRLCYTEAGQLGAFYEYNFLDVEVEGAGGVTGLVVAGGVLCAFKKDAIFVVTGNGPSTYGAQRQYSGIGCMNAATIAAGNQGVYFFDGAGVRVWQPGGNAPVDITGGSQRTLFEGIDESDYAAMSAVWDPINERYLLSFTSNGADLVLMWDERAGAWAKHALEAGAWCVARPDGGAAQVYQGWRGYVCEAYAERSEGAAYAAETIRVTGRVRDGGTNWVQLRAGITAAEYKLYEISVTVYPADGSASETRDIWRVDSGNIAWVTIAWDRVPVAGDTYAIGVIAAAWRSPKMYYGQLGAKVTERFRVLQVAQDVAGAMEARVDGDAHGEWMAVDATERLVELAVDQRGTELVVRLREESADSGFELDAWEVTVQARTLRV